MNRLQNEVYEEQLLRLEADLTARVDTLFRRCPALCGFTIQEGSKLTRERAVEHLEGDLFLADLVCHPIMDDDRSAELCEAISHTLLEMVDERPELAGLLAGRTFARTLH
jgi:hypothetical protein